MKRMIDNKDYELLKDNVKDINEELEIKDTDYIINSVIVEGEEVEGFIIKDVKNDVNYNIVLGGGDTKKYLHNIRLMYGSGGNLGYYIILQIQNDSNEEFTKTSLLDYLYNKGFYIEASNEGYPANNSR